MRRWLVTHEKETWPFIVTQNNLILGEALKQESAISYSVYLHCEKISRQCEGSAEILLGESTHRAEFTIRDNIVFLNHKGFFYRFTLSDTRKAESSAKSSEVRSEIPGRIVKILVKPGDTVKKGDTLLVQEAMKMEISIKAQADAVVDEVLTSDGAQVEADTLLVRFVKGDTPPSG